MIPNKPQVYFYVYLKMLVVYASIFASTGACQVSVGAEEIWPSQPSKSNYNIPNLTTGSPPYFERRYFVVPNESLFFKKRIHLDIYRKNPERLQEMILLGNIIKISPGSILKAREKILSYEGKVTDKEFGDGYVVMRSPF